MAVPTARAQGAQPTTDCGELSAPQPHRVSRSRPCVAPRKNAVVSCSLLVLGALGSGCAAASSAVNTSRAAAAVEAARQSGAGSENEYEMTLAQAYLDKAREEASEAQYLDAIHYAKYARSFAENAVRKSREKHLEQAARTEAQ